MSCVPVSFVSLCGYVVREAIYAVYVMGSGYTYCVSYLHLPVQPKLGGNAPAGLPLRPSVHRGDSAGTVFDPALFLLVAQ